jgi:hypothetical protein
MAVGSGSGFGLGFGFGFGLISLRRLRDASRVDAL